MARPSSQTRPRPPPGIWNKDANPCSVCVPSLCGVNEDAHVLPSSFERARRTSYAYVPAPLFCSQWAYSEPSASRSTDGTSAQLTNQSRPLAAVRAGVQPCPVRSENFNVARSPAGSIQLSNTPRADTVNCGCALPAAAGDASMTADDAADCARGFDPDATRVASTTMTIEKWKGFIAE